MLFPFHRERPCERACNRDFKLTLSDKVEPTVLRVVNQYRAQLARGFGMLTQSPKRRKLLSSRLVPAWPPRSMDLQM
jgi:hypothetical protein